jgi:hypothetical protein
LFYSIYPFSDISISTAKNIAFGKAAVQRSTSFDGFAPKAVDGKSGSDFQREFCIYSEGGGLGKQWWRLDLGESVFIKTITIAGVKGPKDEAVNNELVSGLSTHMELRVGEHTDLKGVWNPVCGGLGKLWHAGWGAPSTDGKIDVECNLQGRFVYLLKKNEWGISVCEVEVWETGWL